MRFSGTYIERLIYFFMPISFVAAILLWLFSIDTAIVIKSFVILTLVCWTVDTLSILIKYNNPQRLMLEGKQIRYGNDNITLSEIKTIEIITGYSLRWTYRMIKIELFASKTIYSMAKPVFIIDLIKGRKSPTEDLIQSVPELKDKLVTKD